MCLRPSARSLARRVETDRAGVLRNWYSLSRERDLQGSDDAQNAEDGAEGDHEKGRDFVFES